MTALYFGTWGGRAGHRFYRPGDHGPVSLNAYPAHPDRDVVERIPWLVVDGRLNPEGEIEGECLIHHAKGWTAVAFAQRVDDHRFGSNGVFIFDADLTFDEAIATAREHFPHVVERFPFDLRLVHKPRKSRHPVVLR